MSIGERLSLLKEVYREFSKDNGSMLAAAISFYEFLAFFPLLLVGVGVLGFVLRSPENAKAVLTRSISHFVVGPQAQGILTDVVNGRTAATGIGFVLLVWSAMSAVVVLEKALNLAWEVGEQRGFIQTRVIALLVLVLSAVLLLLSFGATTALHAVRSSSPMALANFGLGWKLLGYAIPLFLSIAPFVMLYKLLPNTHVSWSTALLAGSLTGILWEAAKQGFSYYAVHYASYNKVYGSLGSVILLMVWIYYSSIITVLGAEFGAVWSARRARE